MSCWLWHNWGSYSRPQKEIIWDQADNDLSFGNIIHLYQICECFSCGAVKKKTISKTMAPVGLTAKEIAEINGIIIPSGDPSGN